jgi:hypothetical protein
MDEELEKAQALWVRYQALEEKMLYFCSAKAKLSEILYNFKYPSKKFWMFLENVIVYLC